MNIWTVWKLSSKACLIGSVCWCISSCLPSEQVLGPSTQVLRFDQDTVKFDTLLSAFDTPTHFIHLHNPHEHAIIIDQLHLLAGASSAFRLNIKGQHSNSFSNLRLLGLDSVLIGLTADLPNGNSSMPYLIEDQLIARTNQQRQSLVLQAWNQDTDYFLDTLRIRTDTRWANRRAVVLEKGLVIEEGVTLEIAEGMRLFMQKGALIRILGALEAVGTFEAPVLFSSFRRDGDFAQAAGLWQGLIFEPSATPSRLVHVRMNAMETAITLGNRHHTNQVSLTLRNVCIKNASLGGILGYNALVDAENLLMYHARSFLLLHYGGTYNYVHCTLVNFPYDFTSQAPSFQLFDYNPTDITNRLDLNMRIRNSLFWGRLSEEFDLSTGSFSLELEGSLLRTNQSLFQPFDNNILGTNSDEAAFVNAFERDYHLLEESPAIDLGSPLGVEEDLENRPRDSKPDAGAFEYENPQ